MGEWLWRVKTLLRMIKKNELKGRLEINKEEGREMEKRSKGRKKCVMKLNGTLATSAREMTREGWFVAPVVMQRDTVYFASPDGIPVCQRRLLQKNALYVSKTAIAKRACDWMGL
nr:hypothetical protein Iba_chr05dCG18930 [Ipomoea batatas]